MSSRIIAGHLLVSTTGPEAWDLDDQRMFNVYHVYRVSPVFWEAIFALTYAPVQKWCILEVSTVSDVCAMALSAPKEQPGASTACICCGYIVEKLKLFFLKMLFKFEYITQTDQTDLGL